VEVHGMLRKQLDGLKTQFKDFVAGDLAAFAQKASKLGLATPVMF